MTDYKPLKVPELKSLLQERSLPVSGNKAELIARLEEHDKSKSQLAETKPAPATSAAIAPPVEDEIDWDDEGTTTAPTTKAPAAKATAAPATKATTTPAAKATATARKGQVESTVKAPTAKSAIDPSKTSDLTVKLPEKKETPVSTEKKGAEAAANPSATESASEAPAVKNYAAGLAASNVIDELEKRKQRAIKFGKQADVDEANKALERAKKFGAAAAEDSKAGEGVKGLDSALPTRELRGKKRHAEGGDEDDNRKRGRGGPRGGRRQQGAGGRRGGSGGRGGQSQPQQQQKNAGAQNKKNGAGNKPAATKGKVTDDPVEKAKAEARAKKFAVAA